MYPRINIDIEKLKENVKYIKGLCDKAECTTAIVTKALCADINIVKELDDLGIDYFAESRVLNLRKLKNLKTKKMLMRIPMLTEVSEVITYADISMNSELSTIIALDKEALSQNKVHDIIIMVDLGDLREGFFEEVELMDCIENTLMLKNINIKGIGVNLTCYGAVIPKYDNLSQLCSIADEIRQRFDLELPIISGGNSSSIYLIDKNELPSGITNLRVGEAYLLGRETAYGNDIKDMNQDVFELQFEIVELKEKPSLPIGEIGVDAFGVKPHYEDKGLMKRAILAIGQQDTDISSLIPSDKKINILGASSDHLLLDITKCDQAYKVGDIISFSVGYGALLRSFTSEYVDKNII